MIITILNYLNNLINKDFINLNNVYYVILNKVDYILNKDFKKEIRKILSITSIKNR